MFIHLAGDQNGLEVPNYDTYNEFGPPAPKRRFFHTSDAEVLENGIHSNGVRATPVFKGYCAGTPPPLLGRVDAR